MLKYKLTQKNTNQTTSVLDVDSITINNINSENYSDKILVNCHYVNDDYISNGDEIFVTNELDIHSEENSYNIPLNYVFNNTLTIAAANNDEKTFSFFINSYFDLSVRQITLKYDEQSSKNNIYFYFNKSHFFSSINLDGDNINKDSDRFIIYVDTTDNLTLNKIPFVCKYVTGSILSCDIEQCFAELQDIVFSIREEKLFFNKITNDNLNNLLTSLFGIDYAENKDEITGNINGIKVSRDNFLCSDSSLLKDSKYATSITTTFYYTTCLCTLNIPFSNTFQTDLNKDENISEFFTEKEKKKSINEIIDMEKDVYYPVCKNNNDFIQLNGIKFNLHFRKRENNEWITTSDSYWNGVNNSGDAFEKDVSNDGGFFSYKNKSEQSDLLCYLNFSDNDIKFSKNKLKKSFLRLTFYDSMDPSRQNLLAYYTLYYNIGESFSKLMKNYSNGKYSTVNKGKLNGIRVNREPYDLSNSNIEDRRLSTQFNVMDNCNTKSSSEGFYIYLWKDNDSGIVPSDIYMKVDFNHAGYGRTIPFMMPYLDKDKHNIENGKIKTFEDILNDFNEKGDDKPYGINQYLKYSYIHFKYQYNKNMNKHIYYLDDLTYGNYYDSNVNDNCLSINLYEAKISNK